MRRKKEESFPIPGQSRLEKTLDWLGRKGTLERWMTGWAVFWLTLCGAILFSVKLLGMPAVGRRLAVLMAACTPILRLGCC